MSGRVTRLVDVLMGVADLTGVDYTRQLSVSQRAAMIRLVKEHAAAVWEEYPWPETVRVEDRYFAEGWDPTGGTAVKQAFTILPAADVSGSMAEKFFVIEFMSGFRTAFQLYIGDPNAVPDIPATIADGRVQVEITANDSAATIAAAIEAQWVSYASEWTIARNTATLTITATTDGVRAITQSGGFTITETAAGAYQWEDYAEGDVVCVADADGEPTYYERQSGEEDRAFYGLISESLTVVQGDLSNELVISATGLELGDGDIIYLGTPDVYLEIETVTLTATDTYTVTLTADHAAVSEAIGMAVLSAPANSAAWEAVTDYVRELELAATGETEMYRVFAVYSEDPDTVANPDEVPFELMGGVIRLDPDEVGRVWVEFQIVPPPLNASVWTNAQAVVVGDVRYYETGNYGDCYQVVTAHNSEVPVGSAKWVKVEMPASIASAVKYLASADLLRADGKEDTALARERKATEALERAMSSFNNHQHQGARWRARVPA